MYESKAELGKVWGYKEGRGEMFRLSRKLFFFFFFNGNISRYEFLYIRTACFNDLNS